MNGRGRSAAERLSEYINTSPMCSTCLVPSYPWILSWWQRLLLQILNLDFDLIAQCPCLFNELVQGCGILLRECIVRIIQRPVVQVSNPGHIRVETSQLVLDAGYLFVEEKKV